MTGTSAAQLPIIDAATFPDDARIKSWSFCDYLQLVESGYDMPRPAWLRSVRTWAEGLR